MLLFGCQQNATHWAGSTSSTLLIYPRWLTLALEDHLYVSKYVGKINPSGFIHIVQCDSQGGAVDEVLDLDQGDPGSNFCSSLNLTAIISQSNLLPRIVKRIKMGFSIAPMDAALRSWRKPRMPITTNELCSKASAARVLFRHGIQQWLERKIGFPPLYSPKVLLILARDSQPFPASADCAAVLPQQAVIAGLCLLS